MSRLNSIALLYLFAFISLLTLGAGYASFVVFQSFVVSLVIACFVALNLVLSALLCHVWLIDRSPKLKRWLSKLPGVTFGTPVPEKLRNQLTPNSMARRPVEKQSKKTSPVFNEADWPPVSPEPFTLASLAFEPPEPLGKAALPVPEPKSEPKSEPKIESKPNAKPEPELPILQSPVSRPVASRGVEAAFHKSRQAAESSRQTSLMQRFHEVCRCLKRMNEEVAVWTEGELASLANTMLVADSDTKDMIAILLPQRVVRVSLHRTFEFEHHATLLNNIILATGRSIEANFINSRKDESTGQCVVNFVHKGKPVTWRFTEKNDALSSKFLNTAVTWVAKQAHGRFHVLSKDELRQSFVFVSAEVEAALNDVQILA